MAMMTDELPAPIALVELSVCNCKTHCNNNRCKCYKNNLPCTDMCKCVNCENDDRRQDLNDTDDYETGSDDDYV